MPSITPAIGLEIMWLFWNADPASFPLSNWKAEPSKLSEHTNMYKQPISSKGLLIHDQSTLLTFPLISSSKITKL